MRKGERNRMGMFDYVKLPIIMTCPTCCNIVEGFQSKDGDCILAEISYTECSNFYTHCDNCKRWIEYKRKPANSINPLDDFELMPLLDEEKPNLHIDPYDTGYEDIS